MTDAHFNSITIDETAEIDFEKCLGRRHCDMARPTEPLSMARRGEVAEPKRNFRDLTTAIMREKGKL